MPVCLVCHILHMQKFRFHWYLKTLNQLLIFSIEINWINAYPYSISHQALQGVDVTVLWYAYCIPLFYGNCPWRECTLIYNFTQSIVNSCVLVILSHMVLLHFRLSLKWKYSFKVAALWNFKIYGLIKLIN